MEPEKCGGTENNHDKEATLKALGMREAVRLVTPVGREVTTQWIVDSLLRRRIEVYNKHGVRIEGGRLNTYVVQFLWHAKQKGEFEGLGNGKYRRLEPPDTRKGTKGSKGKLQRVEALPPVAQPLLGADPDKIKGLILSILEQQNHVQKMAYLKAIWAAAKHEFNAGGIERDRQIFQEFMAAVFRGDVDSIDEGIETEPPIELEADNSLNNN